MTAVSSSGPARSAWTVLRTPGFLFTLGAVGALDALTGLVVFGYGNTFLLQVLHAPDAYPAYSIAIYGLVKLAVAPAGGWLIERTRASRVAVIAAVATTGGLALVLGSKSADAYLGAIGLISFGQALAWLTVFHAIGQHHTSKDRGGATAWMGLMSVGATAGGLGLAALLAETTHWRIPFTIGVVFALAGLGALLGVKPGERQAAPEAPPTREGGRQVARNRRFAATLIIFGHFATTSALIAGMAPLVLRTLNLTLLQAVVVLAPAGVGAGVGMLWIGNRSRPGQRLRLAALLYALAAAAVGLAASAPGPLLLAVAALPLGLALGGAQPVVNASLIDAARAEERSGVALGYLFFVEGLGSVAGPLVVGLVIEGAGVRAGVAAIAVMALLVAAGTARTSQVTAL